MLMEAMERLEKRFTGGSSDDEALASLEVLLRRTADECAAELRNRSLMPTGMVAAESVRQPEPAAAEAIRSARTGRIFPGDGSLIRVVIGSLPWDKLGQLLGGLLGGTVPVPVPAHQPKPTAPVQ